MKTKLLMIVFLSTLLTTTFFGCKKSSKYDDCSTCQGTFDDAPPKPKPKKG